MDSVRRKELQEKFWKGETTLQEERELQSLAGEDKTLDSYFHGFSDLKDASIDIDVKSLLQSEEPVAKIRSLRVRNLWAYAATVALLVFAVFTYNNNTTAPEIAVTEETYDNPEEALEQTEAALAYLMSRMKTGQNKTKNNVKRIEALDIVIPH